MNRNRIRLLCISGVLCAAVFVTTAYLHIPSHNGYIHIGDAIIYLAACLLPTPYAVLVGAGGAALADLLSGYAVWIPGTAVIKALTALCFSHRAEKVITVRNLTAMLPAALLCIFGYYLYESIITANFIAPLAGFVGSTIQAVSSSVMFVVLGLAVDKLRLKEMILGGGKKLK